MSVKELIKKRRTIYQFTEKKVSKDSIQKLLETAIWAPNHKLTEPWRFWVIGENSKKELAEIYADNRAQKHCTKGSEGYLEAFEKAFQKFIKIPQVLMVGQIKNQDQITYMEDFAACSCAIQNIQLAAWEEGIGVQWSTGPIIRDKRTFKVLKTDSQIIEFIGVLYMGFPACIGESSRKRTEEVTFWID